MDHLPTPRSPRYPPPEVLCFVRPDFSCSGSPPFDDYPESRRWKQRAFVDGDFSQDHTEEQSREFLQEWLYFKLMAAVFGSVGVEIDMDDFTRRKDGQLLIDSANLIRYISEFERNFRDMGSQAQMTSVKDMSRVLRVTQQLVVRESGGYSIIGMYYASLLDIPSDGNDHSKCEGHQCLHTTVDEKNYTTRHTHPPPHCPSTVPDLSTIIQPLKSRSIPLLRIREADNGTIEIDIKPYKGDVKYVAISHVWAHGLGNVEGNSLQDFYNRRLFCPTYRAGKRGRV
jgi:hypothetical protein